MLELYRKEPLNAYSIRAIAIELGKAYPLIHGHATKLLKEGILTDAHIGHSRLCKLKLTNPQTQNLLGFLSTRCPEHKATQRLLEINENILLLTACVLKPNTTKEQIILVTDTKSKKEALKKFLPFNNILILDADEFTLFLLDQHNKGTLPEPLLHHAIFYEQLDKISGRWQG